MAHSLNDLLARFDDTAPLERARTIPAAWYHDPLLYEAERERVFGNCWLAAGRVDQVAAPGQFFTCEIAGEPLVILRDTHGVLHALHNVCRHRAARVVCEAEGTCTKLRCRYHGWTYDLSGQLRGVPEFDGVADFRREDHGLRPLAVAEWGPFVWVHSGPAHLTLDRWVALFSQHGFEAKMASLRFARRLEYRVACNWKVYVDNYLDGGYHINTIHPGLAGIIDYTKYHTILGDQASIQVSPLSGGPEELTAVRQGQAAYYAWIFPNFMINLYDKVMDTNTVLPEGPDACRVIFDFYFADIDSDEAKAFLERSIAVSHEIQLEDGEICEDVQRGLKSRSFDTGRFSVKREGPGYHFHRLLAQALREGRA